MINWTVSPAIFSIAGHEVRWYGLLFALGLLVFAPMIMDKIYKKEKLPEKWLSSLYIYVVIATVVGARLGHVLFYDPGYYLANPSKILAFWEGGLASHGGTIGIIIAMWLYSRFVTHKGTIWGLDRLAVSVGQAAGLIRLGNLMNSEIFGHATTHPWGFRFLRSSEYWTDVVGGADFSTVWDKLPPEYVASLPACHPTAIYEAIAYAIVFVVCIILYKKGAAEKYNGLLVGVFLTLTFGARLFIEWLKLVQEPWEVDLVNAIGLNLGQLLSIPFILLGIALIIRALAKRRKELSLS